MMKDEVQSNRLLNDITQNDLLLVKEERETFKRKQQEHYKQHDNSICYIEKGVQQTNINLNGAQAKRYNRNNSDSLCQNGVARNGVQLPAGQNQIQPSSPNAQKIMHVPVAKQRKHAMEEVTLVSNPRLNLKRSDHDELAVARESSSTRKKLKQIEEELAIMREIKSTRTREKLKQAEAELSRMQKSNSSATRDKLKKAEEKLAKKQVALKENLEKDNSQPDHHNLQVEFKTIDDKTIIFTDSSGSLSRQHQQYSSINLPNPPRIRKNLEKEKSRKKSPQSSLAATRSPPQNPASPAAEYKFNKKQELLREKLRQDVNVDLAFIVNCEDEMEAYIEATRRNIDYIIKCLTEKYENRIRLAFVGCMCRDEDEVLIKSYPFTDDVTKFQNFLARLYESSDTHAYLDDVFGGLKTTLNLKWTSRNRIIFNIAGNDLRYVTSFAAHDALSGAQLTQVDGLIKSTDAMNIRQCYGSTVRIPSDINVDPKTMNIKRLTLPSSLKMAVIDFVSTTIDDNIYRTMSDFKTISDIDGINESIEMNNLITLKDYSVADSKIHLNEQEPYTVAKTMEEVQWLEFNIPPMSRLSHIKHNISAINYKWTNAIIEKSSDPFAEGNERLSYMGSMIFDSSYQRIVVKEFKHISTGKDRKKDYIKIMEAQAVTAIMACEFNKMSPRGLKDIHCNHVSSIYHDSIYISR